MESEFCNKCGCEILCELNEGKRVLTKTYRDLLPGRPQMGRQVTDGEYILCVDCVEDEVKVFREWLKSDKPLKKKRSISGFVKYKNAFPGCKFCAGSGCISCEAQRKKAQP